MLNGAVQEVAIMPDGSVVVAVGANGVVETVGSLRGGKPHWFRQPPRSNSTLNAVALSPNGQTAVSTSGDTELTLWDLASGTVLHTFRGHTRAVSSVVFSADGQRVLSSSLDGTVRVWDVTSGHEVRSFIGSAAGINGVAVSPDGRFAASADADGTVRLWHAGTEPATRTLDSGRRQRTYSVAFSPDGLTAVVAVDSVLQFFDLSTGRRLRETRRNGAGVSSVAVCSNGRQVLSGDFGNDIMVHDLATGEKQRELTGHTDVVYSVACAPDSRSALSASWDGTVRLWDLDTGIERQRLTGHQGKVYQAVFSPDGRMVLSAGADALRLWDIATGQLLRTLSGHTREVLSVAISPDGSAALSGGADNLVKLWDLATGNERQTFTGHDNWVWAVSFSSDGRVALSASTDKSLKLWDVERGREIRTLAGHTDAVKSAVFSADGRVLSGGLREIILWDFSRASRYRELEPQARKAVETLQARVGDPDSLAVLGEVVCVPWGVGFEPENCLNARGRPGQPYLPGRWHVATWSLTTCRRRIASSSKHA